MERAEHEEGNPRKTLDPKPRRPYEVKKPCHIWETPPRVLKGEQWFPYRERNESHVLQDAFNTRATGAGHTACLATARIRMKKTSGSRWRLSAGPCQTKCVGKQKGQQNHLQPSTLNSPDPTAYNTSRSTPKSSNPDGLSKQPQPESTFEPRAKNILLNS